MRALYQIILSSWLVVFYHFFKKTDNSQLKPSIPLKPNLPFRETNKRRPTL
ncbi:hypothetical protein [uncultured Gammaproteobacteria bacterium]|nr:hypothetical protein [uncultured Gammaproteobacteria bacterium]